MIEHKVIKDVLSRGPNGSKKLSQEEKTRLWVRRQYIHRHNSYMGHVGMMWRQAYNIANSPSTTPEAKRLAVQIHDLAILLGADLYAFRVEPDGAIVIPDHKRDHE